MPKKKQTKRTSIKSVYAKIKRIIKVYGTVQIDFCNNGDTAQHFYARRREISSDGSCVVSYKSSGHNNFSGFSPSCFYESHFSLDETLEAMKDHDGGWVKILCVRYGKDLHLTYKPFKRRPKLNL